MKKQLRQIFDEIDANKSGDVDINEFVEYYRKTIEPMLEASNYSYTDSYDSNYGGSYQQSSYGEWNQDSSSYSWNESQY